jgi:hypothetical protein
VEKLNKTEHTLTKVNIGGGAYARRLGRSGRRAGKSVSA